MIKRISKKNDLRDTVKAVQDGVIDDIYAIRYYVYGYEDTYIAPELDKSGEVIYTVLPAQSLKNLPDGILYRKAYYKVADTEYPDNYYDLEIVDNMNIWLETETGEVAPTPASAYLKKSELKTVNNQSLVGSGNITIDSGVSMDDVDDEIDEKLDGYATESWVEGKGYTSNSGTVTSVAVKMNGSVKGTVTSSGTIDLGTVITSHQDISVKVDKSSIWTGTEAQWNALTDAQKASYTIALVRA